MSRGWRNLPYANWPDVDRAAWEALLEDGDALDGRGAGAHWAAATRRTTLRSYAGWLGWLDASGTLSSTVSPVDRVTPSQVRTYARALMPMVAPTTVSSYVRDLKVVIKAMFPDHDWRWLMDITNRLKSWARPLRRPRPQTLPADDMFQTAIEELARLSGNGFPSRRANLAYRDTLLVAVLICAPLRLRNLAMIRIARHLETRRVEWHLRFSGRETKNHQPLHLVLPNALGVHINTYVQLVRPTFPGADLTDHLWISAKRAPMAEITIYNSVMRASTNLFGSAVNPHSFRTIAATFLAQSSPQDALRARSLLGHRRIDTTQTHYIKASQILASRNIANALLTIRDDPGARPGNIINPD